MSSGEALKHFRELKKVSQNELAKAIDKTRMMVYRYENGMSSIPDSVLEKALEFLGVDEEKFNKRAYNSFTAYELEEEKTEKEKRIEILNAIKDLDVSVYLDVNGVDVVFIKNGREILKMPINKIEKFYALDIFNQFLIDGEMEVKVIESFIALNNYTLEENEKHTYYWIIKEEEEYSLNKNDLLLLIFDTMASFSLLVEEHKTEPFPF